MELKIKTMPQLIFIFPHKLCHLLPLPQIANKKPWKPTKPNEPNKHTCHLLCCTSPKMIYFSLLRKPRRLQRDCGGPQCNFPSQTFVCIRSNLTDNEWPMMCHISKVLEMEYSYVAYSLSISTLQNNRL